MESCDSWSQHHGNLHDSGGGLGRLGFSRSPIEEVLDAEALLLCRTSIRVAGDEVSLGRVQVAADEGS